MELFQMDTVKLQANTTTSSQVESMQIKTDSNNDESLSSANEANSNYRYDTLDLSNGYLNYKTQSENSQLNNNLNPENSNSQNQTTSPNSDEIKQAISQLTQPLDSDSESNSQIDYEDLAGYTNSEVRLLFQEGKITASEYNNEMDSRLDNTSNNASSPILDDETEQVPLNGFKSNAIF